MKDWGPVSLSAGVLFPYLKKWNRSLKPPPNTIVKLQIIKLNKKVFEEKNYIITITIIIIHIVPWPSEGAWLSRLAKCRFFFKSVNDNGQSLATESQGPDITNWFLVLILKRMAKSFSFAKHSFRGIIIIIEKSLRGETADSFQFFRWDYMYHHHHHHHPLHYHQYHNHHHCLSPTPP